VRDTGPQPAASLAAAMTPGHRCRHRRLINKNQFRRVKIKHARKPQLAPILHVWAILFLGVHRLFFTVKSCRTKNLESADLEKVPVPLLIKRSLNSRNVISGHRFTSP